jgi:hypothetical protein
MNKLELTKYIKLACQSIILECKFYEDGVEPFDNIKTRINYMCDLVNKEVKNE